MRKSIRKTNKEEISYLLPDLPIGFYDDAHNVCQTMSFSKIKMYISTDIVIGTRVECDESV